MFKVILVAADGSAPANNAIRTACDLAHHYQSKLHIVHTPQVDTIALAVGSGSYAIEPNMEQIREAGEKIGQQASDLAKSFGTPPASVILGSTDPAGEAIKAQKDLGADLIICGRRGLGNITGALLGSTSQKIAHSADCAVLSVK